MSKSPKPTFSAGEAQALIDTVRSAPLQNMAHADNVMGLLQRFVLWYPTTQKKAAPKTP